MILKRDPSVCTLFAKQRLPTRDRGSATSHKLTLAGRCLGKLALIGVETRRNQ
jgi:hypothetical protein